MQPSDFLTLLGLALAVWAIIPNKERRFVRLFFTRREIAIFIGLIILIHYLMSFDWLLARFRGLSYFTMQNGIPSSTWAYIVALGLVVHPVHQVSYGYFARKHRESLIELYKSLLKDNDDELLVTYIRRFHLQDIKTYLLAWSELKEPESQLIPLKRNKIASQQYHKQRRNLRSSTRAEYAVDVYRNIIQNKRFVRRIANVHPDLFATIISGMHSRRAANRSLVYLFLQCLFDEKNQMFIEELQNLNNAEDSIEARSEHIGIPIMSSLFINMDVAAANTVWRPISDSAVKSLDNDIEQRAFLRKDYDETESDLWNQKIFIAIVFFDYMVRESIYRNNGSPMGIHYIWFYFDKLVDFISEENEYDDRFLYPSVCHYLMLKQIEVMVDWLELARSQKVDFRVVETIKCLGLCIDSTWRSFALGPNFKEKVIQLVLNAYLKSAADSSDNVGAVKIIEWLRKLFLNPRIEDSGDHENAIEYLKVLEYTWVELDKEFYPERSLEQFISEVLTPLGLNSDRPHLL